jgi:hypothetical protein
MLNLSTLHPNLSILSTLKFPRSSNSRLLTPKCWRCRRVAESVTGPQDGSSREFVSDSGAYVVESETGTLLNGAKLSDVTILLNGLLILVLILNCIVGAELSAWMPTEIPPLLAA